MAQAYDVTSVGTAFLWFLFTFFCIVALGIFAAAFARHPAKRVFHYLNFTVASIAALCYLTMATNLGNIKTEGRSWFVGRYVEWALTTPLLLVDLGVLAKLTQSNIFVLVILDELMIFAGMLGSVVSGPSQWAYFTFSMVAFMPIVWFLYEDFDMERAIEHAGEEAAKAYRKLGMFMAFFWWLYPLAWVLAATNVISVDGEIVFYGVLDMFAKGVFSVWLLAVQPESMGVEEEALELAKPLEADFEKGDAKEEIQGVEMEATRV